MARVGARLVGGKKQLCDGDSVPGPVGYFTGTVTAYLGADLVLGLVSGPGIV